MVEFLLLVMFHSFYLSVEFNGTDLIEPFLDPFGFNIIRFPVALVKVVSEQSKSSTS
jgi:hypothetical protein